jgi:hypothetical protein
MPSSSLESHLETKRRILARARAQATFIESLPRYLLESMLVLGVGFVGSTTYFLRGIDQVVPSLTIFAVAGFRLLPSVNRILGLILGLFIRENIARLGMRSFPEVSGPTNIVEKDRDLNNLIGFQKNESGYNDLILRFNDNIEGEIIYYNCVFQCSKGRYNFKTCELIEGATWRQRIKPEFKDSVSNDIRNTLVKNQIILFANKY